MNSQTWTAVVQLNRTIAERNHWLAVLEENMSKPKVKHIFERYLSSLPSLIASDDDSTTDDEASERDEPFQ